MMLHQDQLPQDSYVLENGLKEWKRVLTDLHRTELSGNTPFHKSACHPSICLGQSMTQHPRQDCDDLSLHMEVTCKKKTTYSEYVFCEVFTLRLETS